MKNKKIFLFVLFAIILLSGCSNNKFVGKWYYTDTVWIYEFKFNRNGTCTYGRIDEEKIKCEYMYDDEEITVDFGSQATTMKYKIGSEYIDLDDERMYQDRKKAEKELQQYKEQEKKSYIKYSTYYKEGKYEVGNTIPSGEYVVFATSDVGGYYSISTSDDYYDIFSIIKNENFENHSTISLSDGQFLSLERCYAVPIQLIDPSDLNY